MRAESLALVTPPIR